MRLKLIAVLVLLTSPAYALVPQGLVLKLPAFPAWHSCLMGQEQMRCFNFEESRSLKLYQNTAQQLELAYADSVLDVQITHRQLELLHQAYDEQTHAAGELKANLIQTEQDRNEILKKAAIAESRSVFGGGLPWLVAAAASGVVVGVLLSLKFK